MGQPKRRVAAIDMGTNAFLCVIGDVVDGRIEVVADFEKVVRLGENVDKNRRLSEGALGRARQALQEYRDRAREAGAGKILAVATSAARDAANSDDLIRIGQSLGIPVFVIPGEKEALLSFAGAISDLPPPLREDLLVVDIGGGSTEFIRAKPGGGLILRSFDIGTVRLTEAFVKNDPPGTVELEALARAIRGQISAFEGFGARSLVFVAGTPAAIHCLLRGSRPDFWAAHGQLLSIDEIEEAIRRLRPMTAAEICSTSGLEPRRADVLMAGAILLREITSLSGCRSARVSVRGLRFGVALNHGEFA